MILLLVVHVVSVPLVVDGSPDPVPDRGEFGRQPDFLVAGKRQIDLDDCLQAPWSRGKNSNSMGNLDGLIRAVSDAHHGALVLRSEDGGVGKESDYTRGSRGSSKPKKEN